MDDLQILRRALCAISEASFEAAFRATLEAMAEAAGADRGFVLVHGETEEAPLLVMAQTAATSRDLPEEGPSRTIARRALETGEVIRLRNAVEEPEFRGRPSVLRLSILSVLAVPVASHGEILAVVYLDSVREAGIFTAESEATAVRLVAAVAPGIRNALRLARSALQERQAREKIEVIQSGTAILGRSPAFEAARERALTAAQSDVAILLQGESGTGKELFARAIHGESQRAYEPFVAINCGAIPEGLLEAELFGYRRGAFTGATRDRVGRIAAADRGTVFLDEVGDMPPALQVKLLRVLQSGEIQKLGEEGEHHVDVRVIAATHRDLPDLVREGSFREDLFYRLRVVLVEIPPLRERGDDVLLLAEALAQQFGREQGKHISGVSRSAQEALLHHPFPGNVRELENAIRHGVVFAIGERVTLTDLPPEIVAGSERKELGEEPRLGAIPRDRDELQRAKQDAAARIERAFLGSLLERANGNVARAARLACMNRSVLHQLMARHGASAADFRRQSPEGDA
ncbi:sigma-54 interaction domain-containing protein [Planctomycetota bacterium]